MRIAVMRAAPLDAFMRPIPSLLLISLLLNAIGASAVDWPQLMVACDQQTGRTVWVCIGVGDKPGYTSPILINYGGLRQLITMTSSHAIGVAAGTGKLLWKYRHPAPYDVNASQPVYHDGHIALFGTWGRGATWLRLNVNGDRCTVAEVWRTAELDNEHGGVVCVGGYLYGQADGNHLHRHWACLDWETGKSMPTTCAGRG